ncbi:hypothetical protein KW801_01620 [Candidatus Saccharibacteria bacterium]|nr:hypothetical protein [Candidatus Saccharibacteria bacterium]
MAKKSKNLLKQKKSFSGAQILLFTLVFATVGAVAIWQSLAAPHNGGGKPKPGGSNNLSLAMVTDNNGDGQPNWGDTITYKLVTTATSPVVSMTCSIGSTIIYSDSHPMYTPNAWSDPGNFTLSSFGWPSGAADCTANLRAAGKNGSITTLASISFHVNA